MVFAGSPTAPQPRVDAELWFRAVYDTPLLLAGIADLQGRVLDANRLSVEGSGFVRTEVVGRLFWDGPWWGSDDRVRERVRALCVRAAREDLQVRDECPWWLPDGTPRWVDLAIHPVTGPGGRPGALFLNGLDITDRVESRRAAAASGQLAAESLRRVAADRADSIQALRAAESELAASLQRSQQILDNVADGIYGLDTGLRATFVNPAAERVLGYREGDLLGRNLHETLHRLPDGSLCPPELCPAVRALHTGVAARSERELFERADGTLLPVELSAVPTITDGVVTGVVESFRDISERLAAERQATQLRALAEREAAARAVTDQLQQALLTAPSHAPDIDVAVRYHPAASQTQVGGDWYDAFAQPDGSSMLVIGDVVGHDTSAAASMAQLKGLLRGIAYASPDSPARLLTRFDQAVRQLRIDALATVTLVRVQTAPSGDDLLLTFASAGHLPPAVVDPDRQVRLLTSRPDLLIGVDPSRPRTDHAARLAAGGVVLLYTDGLIERRDRAVDEGLVHLTAALGRTTGETLDELCDRLFGELGVAAAEDDVALLAMRRRPD